MPGSPAVPTPSGAARVPAGLATTTAWAWRLLLLALVAYLLIRLLALLWIPSLALIAAVLVTALLRPVATLLRHALRGPLAALITLLATLAAAAGVGYVIELRVTEEFPQLTNEVVATVNRLQDTLAGMGVPVDLPAVDQIEQTALAWVQQHQGDLLGYVGAGALVFIEFGTVAVLTVFVTFFLLYDGERIWQWLVGLLPGRAAHRLDRAGQLTWTTLTAYVHGTALIAVIHAVVIGGVAFLLGVPLALVLAVVMFVGSFLPIIGALISGGVAVLVTFGTRGLVAALILLGVLLVEDQMEANLLQPLIVGRYVRLHPLAIGVVLTVGTVLGGVVGALVAVPIAAIVYRAGPALLGREQRGRPAPADRPTVDRLRMRPSTGPTWIFSNAVLKGGERRW